MGLGLTHSSNRVGEDFDVTQVSGPSHILEHMHEEVQAIPTFFKTWVRVAFGQGSRIRRSGQALRIEVVVRVLIGRPAQDVGICRNTEDKVVGSSGPTGARSVLEVEVR